MHMRLSYMSEVQTSGRRLYATMTPLNEDLGQIRAERDNAHRSVCMLLMNMVKVSPWYELALRNVKHDFCLSYGDVSLTSIDLCSPGHSG